MAYEWVVTESIYVTPENNEGTKAVIQSEDRTKAVAVRYAHEEEGAEDHLYFNEEKYATGEAAAEVITAFMHVIATTIELGDEMYVMGNYWDPANGPLSFSKESSTTTIEVIES